MPDTVVGAGGIRYLQSYHQQVLLVGKRLIHKHALNMASKWHLNGKTNIHGGQGEKGCLAGVNEGR